MQELNMVELDEVNGAVTASQVLNYGAAVCAVGAAALGGLALVAASPAIGVAAAAYGVASGGMWLASAMKDMK